MMYSTAYMVEHTGATARQLTKWVEKGWLDGGGPNLGTGHHREWTSEDLKMASLMMRFIRAGFHLDKSHAIAKALVGKGVDMQPARIRVGDNLWLIVKEI